MLEKVCFRIVVAPAETVNSIDFEAGPAGEAALLIADQAEREIAAVDEIDRRGCGCREPFWRDNST